MEINDGGAESPVFYSQVSAAFMAQEITRLKGENEDLQNDVGYWQNQTNHWYMRANYTPEQIAEFIRRRSRGIDEDGEWELPSMAPQSAGADNRPIVDNSSISYNGTTGRPEERLSPVQNGRAAESATTRGIGMSYITRTGNLAAAPKLHEGDKGPYTYARILVTDRIQQDDSSYADGPTIAYEVAVSGSQARELVATAERSGNVRVMFSGRYRVTEWKGEKGTQIRHEVKADQVGISLRGQSVTVERGGQADAVEPGPEFSDDTPF